jgi:iron complex outermembrane recepter protein
MNTFQSGQSVGTRGYSPERLARVSIGLIASSALLGTAFAQSEPAASAASPASADANAAPELSEIVVTGTRIRGVGPVGSAVIPVGSEEMSKTGLATTNDILSRLPQVLSFGAGNAYFGGTTIQNSAIDNTFAKSVNLRGLGTSATLSLVDGHRVAPGGVNGNLFDADTIPVGMLERVEVVADGASAIYGSDAVAGVVNFILRKPFNGAETSARYGAASGASQWQVSQIVGRQWDSGGVVIGYEHTRQSALRATDRSRLYNDDLSPFGGAPYPLLSSPGNVLVRGVPYAIPGGQNGSAVTLASLGAANQPNRESAWIGADAMPEQNRNTFIGNANQQITDGLELFAEGYYTRRNFALRSNPVTSNLNVPDANPYSPCAPGKSQANSQGLSCTGNLTVAYNFGAGLGPYTRGGYEQAVEATGGLRISLPGEWKSSISYTYSQDVEYTRNFDQVNGTALNQVLGAIPGKPANVPYFNAFCDDTAFACNDPATLAYIRGHADTGSTYDFKDVAGEFDGPLLHLPGGDVRLAIGGEVHWDSLAPYSANNTRTPSVQIANTVPAFSSRRVYAGFAEFYVPLVAPEQQVPAVQRLELSLAGRAEHYSDFGSTKNPKIGLNYTPLEGAKLHASFGKSFRAPTLSDINPYSTAGFLVTNVTGSQIGANTPNTLVSLYQVGGNAALQAETARTWSVGLDWTPPQIRGLSASVNYYNIDYRNKIDTAAYNAGLNAAINSGYYNQYILFNPTYYPKLLNGAANPLTQAEFNAILAADESNPRLPVLGIPPSSAQTAAILDGRRNNQGVVDTDGIDFALHYTFATSWGDLSVGDASTYVLSYDNAPVPTAPILDEVNNFGYPLRFRSRADLGWSWAGLSATAFINYANPYGIERQYIPAAAPAAYLHIASYTTVDLTLMYDTRDRFSNRLLRDLRLTLSAQNITDARPPLVLNNGTTPVRFDPQNANPLGRFISFQIDKQW